MSTAAGGQKASDPPPKDNSLPDAQPEQVKLVPLEPKWDLRFSMLYPQGWQVDISVLKDIVQIHRKPAKIFVETRQLRDEPVPATADEMRQGMEEWAQDVVVIERVIPGAVKAYEATYTMPVSKVAGLSLTMYGTTLRQELWLHAPSQAYSDWEPVFRQIMDSFRPSNLDVTPLPGRP